MRLIACELSQAPLCFDLDKLSGRFDMSVHVLARRTNGRPARQARAPAGAHSHTRAKSIVGKKQLEVKNMTFTALPTNTCHTDTPRTFRCQHAEAAFETKFGCPLGACHAEPLSPMPIPSTLYCMETELSSNSQLEADQRAIHLAIEYSMLGLTSDDDNTAATTFDELRAKKSVNMTECVAVPSSEHVAEIVGRQGKPCIEPSIRAPRPRVSAVVEIAPVDSISTSTTRSCTKVSDVPCTIFPLFLPLGCKIKALRAKTNTYIKTPVRGEDPVFVITGRREDVVLAKREILSAAEHFSQIRAQRKNSSLNSGPSSPTGGPGQTTIQVRVPYRVVGLVVGPKGATIKRIQQATNTYIVTPSRDKEPIFEVTGSQENVESARKEIETHIVLRTGGLLDDDVFPNNGDGLNSFGSFQSGPLFANGSRPNLGTVPRDLHRAMSTDSFYLSNGSSKISDYHSLASPFSGSTNGFFFNDVIPSPTDDLIIPNHGSSTGFNSSPPPPSPSIWGTESKSENPGFARANSVNGALNGVGSIGSGRPTTPSHATARRLASEPLLPSLPPTSTLGSFSRFSTSTSAPVGTSSTSVSTLTTTTASNGDSGRVHSPGGVIGSRSPPTNADMANNNNNTINNNNVPGKKKDCVVCCKAEVVAALVPCGHNFFCMECATRVMSENLPCPVCQKQVTQVLRIIS